MEAASIREHFAHFGDRLATALADELKALEERLALESLMQDRLAKRRHHDAVLDRERAASSFASVS